MRYVAASVLVLALALGPARATTRLRVDLGPGPDDTHIAHDPSDPLPPYPSLILECERSQPFRIPEFVGANGAVIPYTIVALPPRGTKLRARVQLLIASGTVEARTPRVHKPQSPAVQTFEIDPTVGLAMP